MQPVFMSMARMQAAALSCVIRYGMAGVMLGMMIALPAPDARAESGSRRGGDSKCAALGEGFARAPGSDTCVRVRTGVRVEAYSGRSMSNAPNTGGSNMNLDSTLSGDGSAGADPWKKTR